MANRLMPAIFALLLLLTAFLSGCSSAKGPEIERISVVCTIFPQYDWVRQILGDNPADIDAAFLLDNRIDLHNYQPAVDDIVKIGAADIFIFVGGESDKWVAGALREAAKPGAVAINLLETLGAAAKAEELLEGMEEDEDDEADGDGLDEHVWLSLKNAAVLCKAITEGLSSLDPGNKDVYENNLAGYIGKLSSLDDEYHKLLTAAPSKNLLFGDRFPFRYLADDYGINCYAAFQGCQAETEASFDTVVFLAKKVDELNLGAVMVTESADQAIAKTIVNNTNSKDQKILVLDSMQSVTSRDVMGGVTYLSIMRGNLDVIAKALM